MTVRRLLRYAFWGALIVGFAIATMPKPIALPGQPSDKIQHILAFLTFAALGSMAYPRVGLLKMGLGLSAYGALIELAQMIPAINRHAELLDWVADTVAAFLVLILAAAIRRVRKAG